VQDTVPIVVRGHQSDKRFGNKLLQWALARKITLNLKMETRLCGFKLDFLSDLCDYQQIPILENPIFLDKFQCNSVEFEWLREAYYKGSHDGIVLQGWGTRVENLIPVREEISFMLDSLTLPYIEIDQSEILISLRMLETLDPIHPDYGPLPLNFYSKILNGTGLKPVFGGQLTESWYLTKLESKFGDASFLPLESALAFETLRRARNKVVSVSTFSWLACYLGDSLSRIHMPLSGAFNKIQRPDWNLTPWSDTRFQFYFLAPLKRNEQLLDEYLETLQHRSLRYPEIKNGNSSIGGLKIFWFYIIGNIFHFLRKRLPMV
jgi:hypothetical protein